MIPGSGESIILTPCRKQPRERSGERFEPRAHTCLRQSIMTYELLAPRRPHDSPRLSEVLASRHPIQIHRSSGASRSPNPPFDEPHHGGADPIYRSFDRFATAFDETDESIVSAGSQLL